MSRPTPRRPASSRATTPRPRRLAGGRTPDGPAEPDEPPQDSEVDEQAVVEPAREQVDEEAIESVEDAPAEDAEPNHLEPADVAGRRSALSSAAATRMLIILVGVLALVLVLQGLWWIRHEYIRDEPKAAVVPEGEIAVPEDRPVLPTELAVQEGVEAAARAAEKFVARTYQNYDQEIDEATELMTPRFAEEFRKTTDDVRDQFIETKTTVQVLTVGQGVVRANDTELQALIFLNRYSSKEGGEEPGTVYTPYRAMLTMVNTDGGWKVDELQTD
jgi:Mce-associated membrane protein